MTKEYTETLTEVAEILKHMETKDIIKLPMKLIEFIEQNISCPNLVNQDIADNLKISEVYLRKLFMRHLKTTPKQYIVAHRLQEAKRLLTDTTLTVAAIAEKCGFSSVYHFSREFKHKNGITPTQYAQNNKILNI